jgi:hypothetical protein
MYSDEFLSAMAARDSNIVRSKARTARIAASIVVERV